MATTRRKATSAATATCEMLLKKAGKSAAHFWDADQGGVCKDMYVPTEEFRALGSPANLKVTIEVAE